jgi:hypothetical protein
MRHDCLRYYRAMRGWCACVLIWACATDCTKANPGAVCTDGTCTDPAFPYCDFDGSIGGTPGECIAVTCTPGNIAECNGSAALTCNATGDGYDLDPCALGCTNNGSAHCAYLQPTYLPNVCDMPAAGSGIVFSGSGSFDPNLDANCTGGIVTQAGAADICVVRYGTIDVASDASMIVLGKFGSGGRAIAFVADQDLTIEGLIDVGGHTGTSGPGGGTFKSGALPQDYQTNPLTYDGGGGAGGATVGGAGGQNIGEGSGTGIDGGALNGGALTMNPGALSVLVGGASSPLANSNPTDVTNQSIGGGGGALELVSCHGTASVTGVVSAGGGGGGGGIGAGFIILPGFGGGAGGNVVIEGVAVTVTGSVFANGGGGGGGAYVLGGGGGAAGVNGDDGSLSDTAGASGGNVAPGGEGGTGGFGDHPGGEGYYARTAGSGANYNPGGGGGSVGFLQTYTPSAVTPTITPAHVSPAFQPNGTVQTR